MALGDYQPEGLFPQEADPELDGGQPEVHPVFVSETPILVDHHALFLDIITMGTQKLATRRKYAIHSLTKDDWNGKNGKIKNDARYHKICEQIKGEHNTHQQYNQLMRLLKTTFQDKYRET